MSHIINPYRYAGGGAPSNGLLNNLAAHYNMDETTGNMLDSHSTANHSNLVSNVTRDGTKYTFNGSNSIVRVPDAPELDPTGNYFAISYWVTTTATSGWMIYKGSNSSNRSWNATNTSSGYAYSGIFTPNTLTANFVTSTTAVNDGSEHHVCLVADGTDWKVYVDGVYEAKTTITVSAGNGSSSLYIGAYGAPSLYWAGSLRYFAIWENLITDGGVSLSSTAGGQVATLYNGGTPLSFSSYTS